MAILNRATMPAPRPAAMSRTNPGKAMKKIKAPVAIEEAFQEAYPRSYFSGPLTRLLSTSPKSLMLR